MMITVEYMSGYFIRLYDRILSGRYRLTPPPNVPAVNMYEWEAIGQSFQELLRGIPVVVADNIAEFFDSFWPEDYQDLAKLDCPNALPPWPEFWLEWKETNPILRRSGMDTTGVLVSARKVEGPHEIMGCEWEIRCRTFHGSPRHNVCVLDDETTGMAIDGTGTVLSYSSDRSESELAKPLEQREIQIARSVGPLMLAMSFMNCRNVRVDWVQPPEKLSKSHSRRHGNKLSPYRVIDIIPMTRLLAKEAQRHEATPTGRSAAFRTVRGHFKRYEDGSAGLFGKHRGTFFFQAHEAGSGERKTRQSGYRIKT